MFEKRQKTNEKIVVFGGLKCWQKASGDASFEIY